MSSSRMGVKGVKRVPARGAPADQQNALLEDYTKLSHKDHMCFVSYVCIYIFVFVML